MSRVAGALVTETLEFDGGRQVTAYVPAGSPEAIVFAGDGQLISSWGAVLEATDLPPTMIVGAHRLEDETLRRAAKNAVSLLNAPAASDLNICSNHMSELCLIPVGGARTRPR
jgi:hypothetical protein